MNLARAWVKVALLFTAAALLSTWAAAQQSPKPDPDASKPPVAKASADKPPASKPTAGTPSGKGPPGPGTAKPPGGELTAAQKAARQKYDEGAKAFAEGRFKDSIDLFLQADAIVATPSFVYNAASAYDAMGDKESALRWSREYVRRAPDAPDIEEVKRRIAGYEQHLKKKGVQQVTVVSEPAGALLVLDGLRAGLTPWTGELRPGSHLAQLTNEGYRQTEEVFELSADRAMDVRVVMKRLPPKAPAKAPEKPADGGTFFLLPTSLAVGSVGLAALVASLSLELARAGVEQDADSETDPARAAERYDDAESLQTASRVMLGVGAALTVAGGVILGLEFVLRSAPDGKATGRIGCGGLGCGLQIAGSF